MLHRDSWIEIDLDALKNNIQIIKEKSEKDLIAVIKANAYGCGDVEIAKAAIEAGAAMLAVSSLDEALSLRKSGIDAEILILGFVHPDFALTLKEQNIATTVVSKNWAEEFVKRDCAGCKVHLKLDTGMNRIGICDPYEFLDVLPMLIEKGVQVEGMFSHYACAEDKDQFYLNKQWRELSFALRLLPHEFKWIHISNSDGVFNFTEYMTTSARCGIAMFGMTSFDTELKQVMSLKSKLICVKKIFAFDYLGYAYTYMSKQDEWIGTIPIGYADGWVRKNQGRNVYLGGTPCEIVGRICMDQCMIRVPEGAKVGDTVELFGPNIPIKQVAEELDTIPYEVMTLLSDRLTRVYYKNGEVYKIVNPRFQHNEL